MTDLYCGNCGWPESVHGMELDDEDEVFNSKGSSEYSINSCPEFKEES